jgi:hypothetical protein
MAVEGEPAEFIQNLTQRANLLVLYEDADYARSLEFLFLKGGFERSQPCLCIFFQPTQDIEKDLALAGIDSEPAKAQGLLQIFGSTALNLKQLKGVVAGFAKNAQKSGATARIVIHHKDYLMSHNAALLEEFLCGIYGRYEVYIMSSYDSEAIPDANLMHRLIRLHDHVMFAPSFGKGLVIKTQ